MPPSLPIPDLLLADPLATATDAAGLRLLCDVALEHARAVVAAICALAEAPDAEVTFDAVLGRLDEAQYAVRLTRSLSQLLGDVHPDEALRDEARAGAARAEMFDTELFLNPRLAAVVKRLAALTPPETLERPAAHLLARVLRELRRNGLDLPAEGQLRLRALNQEITRVGQEFEKNVAEAQGRLELPPSALEGLPAEYAAARRAQALPNGNVVITTDYPDFYPFMRYAADRDAARALHEQFDNRAAEANVPLLQRLLALRHEKARLLGYDTWAEYAIEPRMARRPAAVRAFLQAVREAVAAPAQAEMAEFRAMHEALGGQPGAPLFPQDRYYLQEKVRAAKYGYDSRELSQYLEVGAVKRGLMDVTARLFGLSFRAAPEAPRWHAEVEVYDVLSDGVPIARVLLDLHPRASKFKHAGAFELRAGWPGRGGRGALPVAALVCNLARPGADGADGAALLTHDEVVMLFHEFGHLMHEVLTRSRFAAFAGSAVARDFLEAPSQMFEEWAYRREVLDLFARHHVTGAPIPEPLFAALTRARRLGLALMTQIQLFLAALDIEYHSLPPGTDTTAVLRDVYQRYQPFAYLEGTHYQASFVHLVSYDAAYYGYQWALALATDVLTRFEAEGFLNAAVAADWRAAVLAPGGSEDESSLLQRFLGRPHSTRAYLDYLQRDGAATDGAGQPGARSAGQSASRTQAAFSSDSG